MFWIISDSEVLLKWRDPVACQLPKSRLLSKVKFQLLRFSDSNTSQKPFVLYQASKNESGSSVRRYVVIQSEISNSYVLVIRTRHKSRLACIKLQRMRMDQVSESKLLFKVKFLICFLNLEIQELRSQLCCTKIRWRRLRFHQLKAIVQVLILGRSAN
jgi:hypothetical protein